MIGGIARNCYRNYCEFFTKIAGIVEHAVYSVVGWLIAVSGLVSLWIGLAFDNNHNVRHCWRGYYELGIPGPATATFSCGLEQIRDCLGPGTLLVYPTVGVTVVALVPQPTAH